jgi:hypothetical protein
MVTFVAKVDDLMATATKPDPLTRCLTKLFEFHRAYRVITKFPCEELTYKRLYPMVLTTRRRPADTKPAPDGLILLDMRPNRIGAVTDEIGSVDFATVTSTYTRLRAGDPTVAYLERITEARHAFEQLGKNAEAVLHCATGCEVILDGVLGLALFETGTPPGDVAEIFSKDLTSRVKRHYSTLIGGHWSLESGAVGAWYDNVAGLRNRVVHAAYQPSDAEVSTCFRAAERLARYLADRIFDRSRQYPGTAWTLLGAPGFDARGGASRRVQEWLGAHADITRWISEYAAWRTTVNDLVRRRRTTT